MPSNDAIRVHGLRELNRAFRAADKEQATQLRKTLREVAEPVRSEAEQRAGSQIENIGPRWARMRTGSTQSLVYVAPRQRGARGANPLRRPNLAPLLMDRAMAPALESNRDDVENALGDMLDHVGRVWERV